MQDERVKQAKIDAINQGVTRLNEAQKVAIVKTALAFRFGCNWGFLLRKEENFKEKVELLRSDRDNIRGFATKNGFIMMVAEDCLVSIVHTVLPNALDYKFVEEAQARKIRERKLLQNYITRAVKKAEGKQVEADRNGIVYARFALYSLNDTNYITASGVEYSAFKLNITEAVAIMVETAAKEGKKVYAKVDIGEGEPRFMDLRVLAQQLGEQEMYKRLLKQAVILESETGVAVDFAFS